MLFVLCSGLVSMMLLWQYCRRIISIKLERESPVFLHSVLICLRRLLVSAMDILSLFIGFQN